MNRDILPATLLVRGTVEFCIICGRTGLLESEGVTPEGVRQDEQVRAAWYDRVTIPPETTD